MKFATIVAVIAATVAATNAADVTSAKCPPSETDKLNQIKSERTYNQCVIDGKYSFVDPTGEPTEANVSDMCTSYSCLYYTLPALKRLGLSDCDQTFSTGATVNMKKVVDTLVARCRVSLYVPTLESAESRLQINSANETRAEAEVTSAKCPPSETDKLNQIKSERTYNQCVIDGKYSFVDPTGEPTEANVSDMCTSYSCLYYTLPALKRLGLSDCDQTFSTGATVNMKKVVDTLVARCRVSLYVPTLESAESRLQINSANETRAEAEVTSAKCPPSETDKLNQIKSERTYNQCVIDGKYSFVDPTGEPTEANVSDMCTSYSCFYYTLPALKRLGLSDCDQTFSTGATVNMKKVVDTLVARCRVSV